MTNHNLLLKSLNYSVGKAYFNLGIYVGIFKNSHLLFIDYKNTVNQLYSKKIYNDAYDIIPNLIATNDEILFIFNNSRKFDIKINTLLPPIHTNNYKILIHRIYE